MVTKGMCFMLWLISCLCSFQCTFFTAGSTVYQGSVNSSLGYVWPMDIMNDTSYKAIRIRYYVQFKEEEQCKTCYRRMSVCCPHFLVHTWRNYRKYDRNDLCQEKMKLFTTPSAYNFWNIPLDPINPAFTYSNCKSDAGLVTCSKEVAFAQGVQKPFTATFANCDSIFGVQLNYTITVDDITKTTCVTNTVPHLSPWYNEVALPGIIGFSKIEDLTNFAGLTSARYAIGLFEGCYQHGWQFVARALYPQCVNGTRIFPCRKMCHEFKSACSTALKIIYLYVYFDCRVFLDSEDPKECFIKPVICDTLSNPGNGIVKLDGSSVNARAIYSCKADYILEGYSSRECLPTGKWNNTEPKCVKNVPNFHIRTEYIIAIGISLGAFVVISLILVIVFVRKRRLHQRAASRNSSNNNMLSLNSQCYDAFVSYSSSDETFVEDEFRRKLEEEISPSFKLCIHGRDFLPGHSIHGNIMDAIQNSTMCFIMLSPTYVQSPWCSHEFSVAYNRMVTEALPPATVVLILLEDIPRSQLPADMLAFSYTCTYIEKKNKHFWDHVVKALNNAKEALNQQS